MLSSAVRRFTGFFFLGLLGPLLMSACGGERGPQAGAPGAGSQGQPALLVYSGAGLRQPLDDLTAAFQKETGCPVTCTYGGSAQLTSQILLTGQGDVCLPGDVTELEPLREKGLVLEEHDLVYHVPVLAVPGGNPAGIHSLADLGRPGVRVALGDPQANPIGKVADKLLAEYGLLKTVRANVVVRTPTASELVVYLSMGQADAAIIWAENYQGCQDRMELLHLPELDDYVRTVPVAVLACTSQAEAAQRFAEFLQSPPALALWEKWGYRPVEGLSTSSREASPGR